MEQRIYHGGNATPDSLADFLVQNEFQFGRRWVVQKLGQGNSVMVQIGREHSRYTEPVVSLAIARTPDNENIAVTIGEQQWIHSGVIGYGAMGSLIGLLFTPWALFGLLYPARRYLEGEMIPGELWNLVDTFVIGQGGMLVQQQDISHPHMG